MSLRTRISRAEPHARQDSEPPARRLFAARAAFVMAVTAQTKPPESITPIDLGREDDFALGPARIRPSTCEVDVAGRREIIQPRAMQVLVALARAKGAVVSRDQLVQQCWEGRAIGEDAINRAIAKVRAAAGLSDPPAFEVETIPRIGFRLKVPKAPGDTPPSAAETATPLTSPVAPQTRRRQILFSAMAVLVAAAVALFALLWRGPGLHVSSPAEASIAVLPFLNMSGDPAKEYFSDGFSEELLNDLANTPQLRVAARTSSFAFKGKPANVQEIANKLHVRAVLEGSVREAGDRVRITAQLIDGGSGYHLWSQTYDRQLTDILMVQDEISRAIAAALTNKLLARRHPDGSTAVSPEAYRKYLLGKFYWDHHTEADNERAIALFKEVTTLQPDFSDGFAMLGYALLGRSLDPARPDHAMAVSVTRAALDRALALNPRNVTALIAYMDTALWDQDWNAAAAFVRRMQGINPRNVTVARALGLYYQFLGFPEQSRAAFKLATELDPLSPVTWGSLAVIDGMMGRNDEAIAAGNTALALAPEAPGVLAWVCIAHAERREFNEAHKLMARLYRTEEGRFYQGCAQETARLSGDREKARRIVEERVKNDQGEPAYMGQSYLLVGEYDKAVPLLQHAYEVGNSTLYLLPLDRDTPRDFLQSAAWRELTQRPRFRAWQAAHDAVAASLRMPR
ncbi:MAG TPA: winged helix-turn-helix domain-containing protein [Rhizomicrobium sp.]|nr:winged helix-turn-helix domain-containing protein [Rhizomicrobium sp.]